MGKQLSDISAGNKISLIKPSFSKEILQAPENFDLPPNIFFTNKEVFELKVAFLIEIGFKKQKGGYLGFGVFFDDFVINDLTFEEMYVKLRKLNLKKDWVDKFTKMSMEVAKLYARVEGKEEN